MNLKELKEKLLKDEKFRKEYNRYDLAMEIGEMVIDARVKLGLTQKNLAKLVGTQQPSIARLENGSSLPSLSFLKKIADHLGTYLIAPKFAFLEDFSNQTRTVSLTISDSLEISALNFHHADPLINLAQFTTDTATPKESLVEVKSIIKETVNA